MQKAAGYVAVTLAQAGFEEPMLSAAWIKRPGNEPVIQCRPRIRKTCWMPHWPAWGTIPEDPPATPGMHLYEGVASLSGPITHTGNSSTTKAFRSCLNTQACSLAYV